MTEGARASAIPDPEVTMDAKQSFERWLRFQREAQLANVHQHTFKALAGATFDLLSPVSPPNVTLPREVLLQLRADHFLLLNVVADLLGFPDVQKMSVGEVLERMLERAFAETGRAEKSRASMRGPEEDPEITITEGIRTRDLGRE